jgi:hypothetical protein
MAAAEYPGIATVDIEGIRAGIAAQSDAVAAERARAEKKQKAAALRRLAKWRKGEGGPIYDMDFAAL